MINTVLKLYETNGLGESERLAELVRTAKVDIEREAYDSALSAWFFHLLIMNGALLQDVPELRFKACHICQEDFDLICSFINTYEN